MKGNVVSSTLGPLDRAIFSSPRWGLNAVELDSLLWLHVDQNGQILAPVGPISSKATKESKDS